MSFIKLLSLFDLLTAFILFLLEFSLIPFNFGLLIIGYLSIKSFIFWGDINNIFEILIIIMTIFLMFGFSNTFIVIFAIIYLIQKVIISNV